ncbi:MAG: hypothetical protein ABIK08_11265 [Pseudomonadota bacterium]
MSAVALRPHRFGDPVNPENGDIHDAARSLVAAVQTLDRLGIRIVSIEADRLRNQRVVVDYSRECDALGGVETVSGPYWSQWTANRYGIEIRWMRVKAPA